ncbi:hypothetical protein AB0D99_11955 [Streptomyces sp. NPDC047971]|uniref:hypothetical protein n=1 Tax=Streptomyces sp. NPDC047971 TaxID=3154499 RepID=UPI0033D2662D
MREAAARYNAGPYDESDDAQAYGRGSAGTLALSVVTALPTLRFVKARWLRAWWYAISTALAAAAVLRLTLLAPALWRGPVCAPESLRGGTPVR